MSKYQAWKEFEREIVRKLRTIGGKPRRLWDVQLGKGGKIDIEWYNCVFQLKYGKRPNLKQAWEEAKEGAKNHQVPVGVCRLAGTRKTLVVLSWADFEALVYEKVRNG